MTSRKHNGAQGPVSARNDFFTDSQAISLFTCPALCRVINKSRCSVKLGRTYQGRPPRCEDEKPLDAPFTAVAPTSRTEGNACRRIHCNILYIYSIVYIICTCMYWLEKCMYCTKGRDESVLSYGELIHSYRRIRTFIVR